MLQQESSNKIARSLEEKNEALHHRGYRLTPQRHLVLQLLQESNNHLSIEQLFHQVKQRYPNVSLSTIYRTLDLLKELKFVRETLFPGEQIKYELFSEETHHHLICQRCQATIHLTHPLQEDLLSAIQTEHHFHQVKMDVMSIGYCDSCWQQETTSPHSTPLPTRDAVR